MTILKKEELESLDGFFRAANFLSVAMIYLKDNVLLERKLKFTDIKERLIGHFGSAPNQNFIYTHLNRVICKYNLDMFYIAGPGHAGQALVSCNYLEGTYSKFYPSFKEEKAGLKKLCQEFSYPYGMSSHVEPRVPGSIHEGGELGYSLVHAYGSVLDNPNLIVACCIGDGEAETATLATSWHLNKFLNREMDGVVLPIINLNGYKIANPTILGRMTNSSLEMMFTGMGYEVLIVEGNEPLAMHEKMASTMDYAIEKIKQMKSDKSLPYKLPLIILKTPKGWTGPKEVDNLPIENSFRSHQVPFLIEDEEKLSILESWLASYKPNELFDKKGVLLDKYKLFVPEFKSRMGTNLHTNGGKLRKDLKLPNIYDYNVQENASDMMELGKYLRDVIKLNPNNFRIFGPDEALSNRLNHVFEVTNRAWNMDIESSDEYLNKSGRVIDSFLSENVCEGLLEGYVLTGRHGIFHTYEAFSRIIDSMVSQHLKWIKSASSVNWRRDISSLNIIISSHVWQQDHNGFTHQEPGIINHIMTKDKNLIGVYLPIDANTLICSMNKVLQDKNKVNLIVASKHIRPIILNMNDARTIVNTGYGILNDYSDDNPDIVLIASSDTPTMEVIESARILKKYLDIKIRVVAVIDLVKFSLLKSNEFNHIFTRKPKLFVFHGYPNLILEMIYGKTDNMKVLGYNEMGSITTPFDMRVKNKIDRYNICLTASRMIDKDTTKLENYCKMMLKKHKAYIKKYGKDMDNINM
ncbi:MAG: phosphoketolase family protein [Bacilli bacterium]|nr:phosphoketolase family protein [Bacilli bacterium]